MAVLDTVKAEIEDLQGTVSRERSYLIKEAHFIGVIEHIANLQAQSEPFPEESPFENYEEWQLEAEKELKSAQNSLTNVTKAKELLVALNAYVEQNPGV